MTDEELGQYYSNMRQHYLSLPFDVKSTEKAEKHYRFFSRIFNLIAIIKRTKMLKEEFLPNEEGLIFVSNHIGSYDQFYIDRLIRKYNYSPHYLVKEKVMKFFLRWNLIYKHVGVVVVNQESIKSWQSAEKKLIKYLLHKKSVFIFPEATRRGENNIGEFKTGVAKIAQKTGSKIVTMAIKNTKKFFIGKPIICLGDIIEVGEREDIIKATDRIKNAVLNAYSNIIDYEKR
ncbi:MAG: 1-acyl-sn-glycerol-3-phosphate acyltransferase [Defluviitaleaceae bacterium]|nr:1-acyl-sn-glycerol-3-phosphate acyltransferase [Defluviitaleaceae bacterium]